LIKNKDNDKLKIGITNNLMRRLSEIKKSFQFCGVIPELDIECYIEYKHNLELEQYLHKELKEYNYQNEWFSIDNIDIVLEKLNDFKYEKELKEIKPLIKENFNIPEENNIDKFMVKSMKYYLYNHYEWHDCKNYTRYSIYIKCNGDEWTACSMIDDIQGDIFHDWNYFTHCYEKERYNKFDASDELIDKFKELNTNAIIKTENGNINSLEDHFIQKYNNYLSNTLTDIKDYINNTDVEIENTYDISLKRVKLEEKIEYLINRMKTIKENLSM